LIAFFAFEGCYEIAFSAGFPALKPDFIRRFASATGVTGRFRDAAAAVLCLTGKIIVAESHCDFLTFSFFRFHLYYIYIQNVQNMLQFSLKFSE
jgi:hypothetical protein